MEICKVVLTGKYIMQITLIKLKFNTTMKFHHPIMHFTVTLIMQILLYMIVLNTFFGE